MKKLVTSDTRQDIAASLFITMALDKLASFVGNLPGFSWGTFPPGKKINRNADRPVCLVGRVAVEILTRKQEMNLTTL